METLASGKHTTIGRLGLRGEPGDAFAARRRIERLLEAGELHPKSVSAEAILCVRTLGDPLPGRVGLEPRDLGRTGRWTQAVARSIEAAAARAARPIEGAVPAAADAVLFADRSELLACAAIDGCSGSLAGRWWWRHLVAAPEDGLRAVLGAWRATPEYVPAALEILARRGEAVRFAQGLAGGDAAELVGAVAERFGLREIVRVVALSARGESDGSAGSAAQMPSVGGALPWQPWVPEAREGERVTVASLLLVGIGLMLHRAPERARSASFAAAVHDWVGVGVAAPAGAVTTSVALRDVVASVPREVSLGGREAAVLNAQEGVVPRAGLLGFDVSGLPSDEIGARMELAEPGPSEARRASPVRSVETGEPASSGRAAVASWIAAPSAPGDAGPPLRAPLAGEAPVADVPAADVRGEAPPPFLHAERVVDSPRVIEAVVHVEAPGGASPESLAALREPPMQLSAERSVHVRTELGGLFFLINLGLFLELYGDFSQPLRPGIALSIWDFVTLVGSELLGGQPEDPVWGLLAELAGREEGASAGEEFQAPEEWRVPAEWLRAFGDGHAFGWSARGGRLVVRHPEGFVLVDVALEAGLEQQVEREVGAYAGLGALGEEDGAGSAVSDGAPLQRWLGWLMPYVRARLARALGVDAAGAGVLICRVPGRVALGRARLEVVMSLAELPIEIRLAGLDRDPGWVPASGRVVEFHFE